MHRIGIIMNTEFKITLIMNLMYNLFLAVILSVAAQMMRMGSVSLHSLHPDIITAYVLEMIIAFCLPFSKWSVELACRYAEPGTLKHRVITTTGIAIPFAIAMCLGMSFIGSVVIARLPIISWLRAFGEMLPMFTVMGWILSFFFVPVFHKLARRIFTCFS